MQDNFHIETLHIETLHIETFHIETFHIETFHIETFHVDTFHVDTFDSCVVAGISPPSLSQRSIARCFNACASAVSGVSSDSNLSCTPEFQSAIAGLSALSCA